MRLQSFTPETRCQNSIGYSPQGWAALDVFWFFKYIWNQLLTFKTQEISYEVWASNFS